MRVNSPPRGMRRLFTRRRDTISRDTRLARSEQLDLPRVRLATQRIFPHRAATYWNMGVPKQTEDDAWDLLTSSS